MKLYRYKVLITTVEGNVIENIFETKEEITKKYDLSLSVINKLLYRGGSPQKYPFLRIEKFFLENIELLKKERNRECVKKYHQKKKESQYGYTDNTFKLYNEILAKTTES